MFCLSLAVASLSILFTSFSSASENNIVTYGSLIKLLNTDYDVRLHSHDINYGSGSGQQSVTGIKDVSNSGSYWLASLCSTACLSLIPFSAFVVRKEHNNDNYFRGEPVGCGQIIRLTHRGTEKNLHSHHFQAPISRNYEVSAFGNKGSGDDGDNWKVVCGDGNWTRDTLIKLRHIATDGFLHVSGNTYQHPIPGQFEISSSSSRYGSSWKAVEGVYIQPLEKRSTVFGDTHEEL